MSKLTRVFQKQFGVDAGNSDVGIFGSLAASNPQYSKDPETIQSLNAFLTGWAAETIANNRPALEDFNAIDFLTFYQLCYLLQTGVAEWNAETTYYIGSIVNDGTGVLYKSLTDSNLNNAVSDDTKWAPVVTEPEAPVFESALLHVRDEKAANTAPDNITAGDWRTRVLNTVKTNEISGASLASNQITLPAGTYYVDGFGAVFYCEGAKTKIRNITAGTDLIIGSSAVSHYTTAVGTYSVISGRFTLATESVIELQQRQGATYGGGTQANVGAVEVYSELKIWKVA